MDLHPIHSFSRTKADIKDIEQLGDLINQLGLQLDCQLVEAFQRLVELAGSRDFLPFFSQIQSYALKLKWAREGRWNTGYVVPWMNLYSSLGSNSHLVSIATHCTQNSQMKDHDELRGMNFKSPLIKASHNCYGIGSRPVEIHREEWLQTLQIVSSVPKPRELTMSYVQNMRGKRPMKVNPTSLQVNNHRVIHEDSFPKAGPEPSQKPSEKELGSKKVAKVTKKKDPSTKAKRAAPYTKSKVIYDLEKLQAATISPSPVGHAAAAAGPNGSSTTDNS
jgi:hypothetical protein